MRAPARTRTSTRLALPPAVGRASLMISKARSTVRAPLVPIAWSIPASAVAKPCRAPLFEDPRPFSNRFML